MPASPPNSDIIPVPVLDGIATSDNGWLVLGKHCYGIDPNTYECSIESSSGDCVAKPYCSWNGDACKSITAMSLAGYLDVSLQNFNTQSPPENLKLIIYQTGNNDDVVESDPTKSCQDKEDYAKNIERSHRVFFNVSWNLNNEFIIPTEPIGAADWEREITVVLADCTRNISDVGYKLRYSRDNAIFSDGTGPNRCLVPVPNVTRPSFTGEIAGYAIGIVIFAVAILSLLFLLVREFRKGGKPRANHSVLRSTDEQVQMGGGFEDEDDQVHM